MSASRSRLASSRRRSLFIRWSVLFGALVAALVWLPADVSVQTPQVPPSEPGETATIEAAEARQVAAEARKAAPIELADGLEVSVWATGHLVADALALDVAPDGAVYVGGSPRSGQLLDTREHPDWVPELHALQTTEDLRQFFRRKMATDLSEENTWLPDYNNDGVRDYRDLTVIEEKIYRIEDTDGDGVADKSTVVFSGFNEDIASDILGGLMVHASGDIYATAAPDLWRLRDTNGDGVLDSKESISHGYSVHPSFSGHDMSALVQGPDGMIYWKIGEIGMNVVDRNGRRWAHPNTGAVLRANPDGSDFEVFASGVRNPQEIAFDQFGNLVSVDNDGDYPGETERIIYISEGSDTGWRSTWQYGKYTDENNNRYNPWIDEGLSKVRFDGQAAYITPPIAPFAAGPSGFAYNPGTALDASWKNHFFVTSFTGSATNARIFGFTLKPDGAGFALDQNRQMVQGVLSPGMAIGPDGAMYLTDWVRGWGASGEGRVWKLDSVAGRANPVRAEVQALLTADFESRETDGLVTLLHHEDMRVRLKAQFELVRRGDTGTLTAAVGSRDHQLARVHATWGLGQLLRSGRVPASSVTPLLADADPEIRAQAAKVLGHARSDMAAAALVPLLEDSSARVRYFATTALGRVGHGPAVPAIVAMLAADDGRDVLLRTAGFVALERIGDRAALTGLAQHQSENVRLAAVVALRRLRDAGVARFLADSSPEVVTEAARAINDEGGIPAALPELAALLERASLEGEPLARRALSANLRVGDRTAVSRVAAFARRGDVPEALRVEAIDILGVWPSPSNLDRVDGAWIAPLPQRDGAAAEQAVVQLATLIETPGASPAVKVAWIEAIAKLGVTSQAGTLLAHLRNDPDTTVRSAALRGLQRLEAAELEDGVRAALADADNSVRMAALSAMPEMAVSAPAKVELLTGMIETGTVGEQQNATEALGRIPGTEAVEALDGLADRLAAGTMAPALQLDLLEALRASEAEPLLQRLEQLKVGRDLGTVGEVFPAALANGGAVDRGRRVATQHDAAQCSRCHTLGPGGTSDVGPSLIGVGNRLNREQLLESLIRPSARLSPGFGQVSVTLRDGRKFEGTLREESDTTLVVEDATAGLQRVPVADIASRTNGVSAMPQMDLLLTPREIRDVVEFLASQK